MPSEMEKRHPNYWKNDTDEGGKNLFESFRALAQQILVNVLAHLIEQVAIMGIQKLLKKEFMNLKT